jgi:hypothetical protein
VIELVVLGALAFCGFVVLGTLVAAASIVGWIISLPFRLLGVVVKGVGLLLGLPFLILALTIGAVVFGIGALVTLLPLAPLLLLVCGVVWLVRRSTRHVVTS